MRLHGRLVSGVSRADANRPVSSVADTLASHYPATNQFRAATVEPFAGLGAAGRPESLRIVSVLFSKAGVVLLVVCVNISGMMLVRGTKRAHELSNRAALGADQRTLAQHLFFEALVLAGPAGMLVIRQRRVVGGDGAEQLSEIVLLSACLALLPYPGEARVQLAVLFIAAQLTLSYVAAGIFKLISSVWRSGKALPGILNTYGHGVAWASYAVGRWRCIGFAAGWFVMLFEVIFPVVFVGPPWVVAVLLATGFAFHLGCAVLMGLNSFVWAYPAALRVRPRDPRAPRRRLKGASV